MRIVECVPNFSEGRRKEVIDAIANAIRSTPNITLLDIEYNADHNRSVITFVGEPESVKLAALAGAAKAVELIDLTQHKGEHPRMGAVDVVPFVQISGQESSKDCGERLARIRRGDQTMVLIEFIRQLVLLRSGLERCSLLTM